MFMINDEIEFKRIAYAFMTVFSNIEAVTISADDRGQSIDFWKKSDLTNYRGVYSCRRNRYPYCYSILSRNKYGLICSLPINYINFISDTSYLYVSRNDFLNPFKNNRISRFDYAAKMRLEIIAKCLRLKKIEIKSNNVFELTDDSNNIETFYMRGAGGGILYRGEISY